MADWPDDVNEEDRVGLSGGTDKGMAGTPSLIGTGIVGTDLGEKESTMAGTHSPTEVDAGPDHGTGLTLDGLGRTSTSRLVTLAVLCMNSTLPEQE